MYDILYLKNMKVLSLVLMRDKFTHCIFYLFFYFVCQNRLSMCSLRYHGTQSVEEVDLELSEIHLHLTPWCWD